MIDRTISPLLLPHDGGRPKYREHITQGKGLILQHGARRESLIPRTCLRGSLGRAAGHGQRVHPLALLLDLCLAP